MPAIFFPLLNDAAKQKDFQGSTTKHLLAVTQSHRTDKLLGTIKKSLLGSKDLFAHPVQGSAVLESITLSQKSAQAWSCALKTLMKCVTQFPINRPASILGKSRLGFVIQRKAVTSLRACSSRQQPVSNHLVEKQQNFPNKRPIQNRLASFSPASVNIQGT